MKNILLVLFVVSFLSVIGQEEQEVYKTFKTTRIINSNSTETLWKKELDFRVGHRFGDLLGNNGGVQTFFGLESASDITIGFDYGITNNLTVGLHRLKGAGPYRELFEGSIKYKLLRQTNKKPVSIAFVGKSNITGMTASGDSTSSTFFTNEVQRLSYSSQLLISRKFSEYFSLQFMPTYVHRNLVANEDQNGMFAVGLGTRIQLSKMMAIVGEYHYVIRNTNTVSGVKYFNPFGLGVEFDTGGHVFHLNFTNSRGFGEAQFIPSTSADVSEGEFRYGFTIARIFKF